MPESPPAFEGTLAELFRDFVLRLLPAADDVQFLHEMILAECRKPDPLFVVRHVQGTERGRVYTTSSGQHFVPSDNAPAWWMHYVAFTGRRPADIAEMPTHMFEVGQRIPTHVSAAGWHVAHIYEPKDRTTDWSGWTKANLTRRFIRNVHPCNCFYLPKPEWRRYGSSPEVIAFFAQEYASRFGALWEEFRALAAGPLLPDVDTEHIPYVYPTTRPATSSVSPGVSATYRYSRLCFKANIIEPLGWDDVFEVVTPIGTFRMSKAEFYRDFPGVVKTSSYRKTGIYHFPIVPLAATRYRLTMSSESAK